EPSIIEHFYAGQAVRVVIIGDRYWQIKLEGDGWLAYTRDMTMWTLDDVTSAMQGKYEHYLPDEYEDTDEL
ncbi:MAG: hypothetical protein AAF653_20410, partial [Chloroflexota bacterium]